MDVSTIDAVQKYAASRPATEAEPATGTASDTFTSMARDFAATLRESEEQATSAMAGEADPHALVQALAQTELAVETAVTVRDRVVEAYQQILRMPV